MAKRIRSGDVLLQAERTKRNARAELIAIAERAPLPNGPCAIPERAIEMAP